MVESAVIDKIIKTLNKFEKLRIAEPGEFTRRAFENNKLDLNTGRSNIRFSKFRNRSTKKTSFKSI